MTPILAWAKKNSLIVLLLIFIIGALWRFINYDNRWTFSQDQARDAIIALISLQNGTLPLVGPPSSVGEFSFGPIYYWLIVFFSFLAPWVINAPWIGFTIFSLVLILIFYLIGKDLGSKSLGLIFAVLAACASGPVFHSNDMLNPIPLVWITSIVLLCLVRLIEKKQAIYSVLLGLSIGVAINFHFQALGLVTIPLVALFFNNFSKNKKLVVLAGSILGILIALIPLIIFNFQTENKLLNNILSVPSNSSLTLRTLGGLIKDVVVFWPELFGEVLVFMPKIGYLFYLVVILCLGYLIYKKQKFPKSFWIIIISLIIQAIILRIYGGARTPVYLLTFHAFIILLTGWSIWLISQKQRYLGLSIFFIFLVLSSYSNFNILKGYTQKPLIYEFKSQINEKHRESIDFYTTKESGMISLPLYYLLLKEGRISENGYSIGACGDKVLEIGAPFCPVDPTPFFRKENLVLFDLSSVDTIKIEESGFERLTSEKIYNLLTDYYR